MAGNFFIGYPDNGTQADIAFSSTGIIHIDFREGILTKPDGTKVNLQRKLLGSGQDYIRSLVFQMSQPCDITLGQDNSTKLQLPAGDWHIFENIQIQEVTINMDFKPTPDQTDFQLIAATSRSAFYKPSVVKYQRFLDDDSITHTDAYQTILLDETAPYSHITLQLTAVTNGLTYKIMSLGYATDLSLGWNTLQDETAVAAGDTEIVQIQGAFKRLWVQAKNTTPGSDATGMASLTMVS